MVGLTLKVAYYIGKVPKHDCPESGTPTHASMLIGCFPHFAAVPSKADLALGITHVIHYQGARIKQLETAWRSVARRSGASSNDGPHIMRHTAATWQMQAGTNIYEAAGYLGMTAETLLEVYGHQHPDFQANASKATGRRKTA